VLNYVKFIVLFFFYVFICGCAYAKRRYYILVSNSK